MPLESGRKGDDGRGGVGRGWQRMGKVGVEREGKDGEGMEKAVEGKVARERKR